MLRGFLLWGFELSIISCTVLVGGNRKCSNTSGHISVWSWTFQINCCDLMQRTNPRRSCHPAPCWAAEPPAPESVPGALFCCLTWAELCLVALWISSETGTFVSIYSSAWAGLTMQIWELDFFIFFYIMCQLNLYRILQGVSWAQMVWKDLTNVNSRNFSRKWPQNIF